MLLVLTVCDIRAVGPGVWNGWKGQLLRTLFWETEVVLGGGHSPIDRKSRVAAAQEALRRALPGWSDPDFEAYAARHYPAYWLKVDLARQVAHAKLLYAMAAEVRSLATEVATDAFRGVTELTVVAPDHPRLLSIIAGACASAGGNIVDAQIFTTTDGLALDTIFLSRAFDRDEDEMRRAERIAKGIEKALRGEIRLGEMVAAKRGPDARAKAFALAPDVTINNNLSNRYTVLEVSGLDRPGLLYDLTAVLSRLNLNIGSAHIVTFGEKAVDAFYVTDLTGREDHLADPPGGDQAADSGDFRPRRREARVAAATRRRLIFGARALISRADVCRTGLTMNDTTKAQADDVAREAQAANSNSPSPTTPAEAERDGFAVIEELNAENAALKDRVLRTLAEMENLRRRTEREVGRRQDLWRDRLRARHAQRRRQSRARARKPAGGRARAADAVLKGLIEGVELTARDLSAALGAPWRQEAGAAGREVRSEFPSGDVRGAGRNACRRAP